MNAKTFSDVVYDVTEAIELAQNVNVFKTSKNILYQKNLHSVYFMCGKLDLLISRDNK